MRKVCNLSILVHLAVLIVAIVGAATSTAFYDSIKFILIGLIGVIVSGCLSLFASSGGIQGKIALVLGVMIYLSIFTLYISPSFLKDYWNLAAFALLTLLILSYIKAHELEKPATVILYALSTVITLPILFKMASPTVYVFGIGALIISSIVAMFYYWRSPK